MKILVVDDSYVQIDAAKKALAEHDLTVAYSFNEAKKLLTPQRNNEKVKTVKSISRAWGSHWEY